MGTVSMAEARARRDSIEDRVQQLLAQMTLMEKVGQMNQVQAADYHLIHQEVHGAAIRAGHVGSIINTVDPQEIRDLQRVAVEESRLGIPLLFGRDVIHGFHTILPIPLGQAASFNPEIVRDGARVAAAEARAVGVNWTFAPMLDVSRDPRWGRIAESFGEDPLLTGRLGAAMVRGLQGEYLGSAGGILACAKHFVGYGASEGGRDYSSTNISENELRNSYLGPFLAALEAGCGTVMTSFSDLDGTPASANRFLLRDILREAWGFSGFVVSDWESISQLATHGLTEGPRESVAAAANAGVDMDMAGGIYLQHLPELVQDGVIDEALIDQAVAHILRIKMALGLFESPYGDSEGRAPALPDGQALRTAREAAVQSVVMLKNAGDVLPLQAGSLRRVAVIGPLADAPHDQLGTWVFDGRPELSVTCLEGIREHLGERVDVDYVPALATSRSRDESAFPEAVRAAADADVALLFLGEEAILSGEAHCRAHIDLPGSQEALLRQVKATGTPVIAVILAGRPLTLTRTLENVDALLYAWHPGTMAGPAIADLLFGVRSPSGKLPVSFPRAVGQIPIYYNHRNTGKPPVAQDMVHIDDIDPLAPQTSLGMCAFHLDEGADPLFPFGFGLSYGRFYYWNLHLSTRELPADGTLEVSVDVANEADRGAEEVVQLYVRDPVASITRPVRELKAFQRIHLDAGETRTLHFRLSVADLAFYNRDRLVAEAGEFQLWVGGSSSADLQASFRLLESRELQPSDAA